MGQPFADERHEVGMFLMPPKLESRPFQQGVGEGRTERLADIAFSEALAKVVVAELEEVMQVLEAIAGDGPAQRLKPFPAGISGTGKDVPREETASGKRLGPTRKPGFFRLDPPGKFHHEHQYGLTQRLLAGLLQVIVARQAGGRVNGGTRASARETRGRSGGLPRR